MRLNQYARFCSGFAWICLTVFVSACSDKEASLQEITVPIIFSYEHPTSSINSNEADALQLHQLKFFIHNVKLKDTEGKILDSDLIHSSPWQTPQGALIKIDNQGGQANKQMLVAVTEGTDADAISGIQFTLGLDFPTNHQDPLQATTPFNVSSMYWSWQIGYKFLRLDFSLAKRHFNFHLGSTGCTSPSPMRPPQQECERANLATIELQNFNPYKHSIGVNIATIINQIAPHIASTHCTGNYQDDSTCRNFIEQLGLAATSGDCVDQCKEQTFFTVEPQ